MPINAHPEFIYAEKEFNVAQTPEEKIEKLRKMISYAPAHKGGEKLRAQLKTRLKKLLEQQTKSKKSGKSSRMGIKKSEMQAVIVGLTNSGKSSLLSLLTNAHPNISKTNFTTTIPIIGMMPYQGTQVQLIEIPAIDSDFYDKGIVHTADSALILIRNLEDLKKIESILQAKGKRIIVVTKSDLLSESEKRKISATLQSKKYNFIMISSENASLRQIDEESIKELKEKIFKSFNKIRIYTKEPGKQKSDNPLVLEPETTIKEVAEKILKGFSEKVKETKIWGPSSKFPGQKVGLRHKLKDLDVVEFKTK